MKINKLIVILLTGLMADGAQLGAQETPKKKEGTSFATHESDPFTSHALKDVDPRVLNANLLLKDFLRSFPQIPVTTPTPVTTQIPITIQLPSEIKISKELVEKFVETIKSLEEKEEDATAIIPRSPDATSIGWETVSNPKEEFFVDMVVPESKRLHTALATHYQQVGPNHSVNITLTKKQAKTLKTLFSQWQKEHPKTVETTTKVSAASPKTTTTSSESLRETHISDPADFVVDAGER